jgi:6,7-dimethyl-8-ribityllumazine synthase
MLGAAPDILIKKMPDQKFAIISSSWHPEICDALIAGAKRALNEAGIQEVVIEKVAGSFEIPLASQFLFDQGVDAIVAVGLVLRGQTPHFEYVCQAVTDGVLQVSLTAGKPIGFGVLMCDNLDQAIARSGIAGAKEDKGYDAAQAALNLLALKANNKI